MEKKISKKGQAGLEVFLQIVAMVFVIGIIVMAFVLTGSNLESSVSSGGYSDATSTITVINDTKLAVKDAINWFPIFITIGAVVVLILLIVVIITALRSGGMMGA